MQDKPRIIHLVRPPADELREHVVALATGLAGHRVEPVVVGPLSRGFREELSQYGIRWVDLPLGEGLGEHEHREAAQSVGRLVGSLRPALIHAHGLEAAQAARLAVRDLPPPPTPILCSPHGLPEPGAAGWLARRRHLAAVRAAVAGCSALIAACGAEHDQLVRLAGGRAAPPADAIVTVPPGVEKRRRSGLFDAGEKRFRVGLHRDAAIVAAVSPLRAGCRVDDLLHAAAIVSHDKPNVEFAIIGDGPQMEGYKALAHRLGLTGNTIFLGSRPDAMDIVSACNVVVALSDDPRGIIHTLEVLARGLRVVGANLPGLRELLSDASSIPLIDPGDHEALAAAISAQLEQMAQEEDEIVTADGLSWGVSSLLASQSEYDLDRPGLDPRDRKPDAGSQLDRLFEQHSVESMLTGTMAVYRRVLPAT